MAPIRCGGLELFVAEDDAEGDPLGKPLWSQKEASGKLEHRW